MSMGGRDRAESYWNDRGLYDADDPDWPMLMEYGWGRDLVEGDRHEVDALQEVEMIVHVDCPMCLGHGFLSEHANPCNGGEGSCDAHGCPVQFPCPRCRMLGFIEVGYEDPRLWPDVVDGRIEEDLAEEWEAQSFAERGGVRRVGPGLVGLYVKALNDNRPNQWLKVGYVNRAEVGGNIWWDVRVKATSEWFRRYPDGDHVTTMTESEAPDPVVDHHPEERYL